MEPGVMENLAQILPVSPEPQVIIGCQGIAHQSLPQ